MRSIVVPLEPTVRHRDGILCITFVRNGMSIGLPILTVEWNYLQRPWLRAQTANVHINSVWIRPGDVKGFDAAYLAKLMLCNACVELICGDELAAGQQLELRLWNDQMQETGHSADGAIAVLHLHVSWRIDFKFNCSAVATAIIDHGTFSLWV